MFSFTSSSKFFIISFFFCVSLLFLIPHEYMVRKHFLSGGFMVTINRMPESREHYKDPDFLVIGSSRAQECIRPEIIKELSKGLIERPINYSSHSGTSPDYIKGLYLYDIYHPRYIVITVEPLHFSKYSMLKNEELDKPLPAPFAPLTPLSPGKENHVKTETFLQAIDNTNSKYQKFLASLTEKIVNRTLLYSSDALQRRKLLYWFYFFNELLWDNPRFQFKKSYDFNLVGRRTNYYTKVIYEDHGYEGHKLYIPNPLTHTRADAFQDHMGIYKTSVLPSYNPDFIKIFEKYLEAFIKVQDVKVILIRLPIYKDLYSLENHYVPDFNAQMNALAERQHIQYVDMNQLVSFTNDPSFFTDASHMEHEKTEIMTKELMKVLNRTILKNEQK